MTMGILNCYITSINLPAAISWQDVLSATNSENKSVKFPTLLAQFMTGPTF